MLDVRSPSACRIDAKDWHTDVQRFCSLPCLLRFPCFNARDALSVEVHPMPLPPLVPSFEALEAECACSFAMDQHCLCMRQTRGESRLGEAALEVALGDDAHPGGEELIQHGVVDRVRRLNDRRPLCR
jgi:hypothetical protein